jgi:hypothetical protein
LAVKGPGLGCTADGQRGVRRRADGQWQGAGVQVQQAEGVLAGRVAGAVEGQGVAAGSEVVDDPVVGGRVEGDAVHAAAVARVAGVEAARADERAARAGQAPGQRTVTQRVEDDPAGLVQVQRVDDTLAGRGDAAGDGAVDTGHRVDDRAGQAEGAAVLHDGAAALVEAVVQHQVGWSAAELGAHGGGNLARAARRLPDAQVVDAAREGAEAAVGFVGATDHQRLGRRGERIGVAAHRAAGHLGAVDEDLHQAAVAVDAGGDMGPLARLDQAAGAVEVLLAAVAGAEQQAASVRDEEGVGAVGAERGVVAALVGDGHVAVGEPVHRHPAFHRHVAAQVQGGGHRCLYRGDAAHLQGATQPCRAADLRLAQLQRRDDVLHRLHIERIGRAGGGVADAAFDEQRVGAGLRQQLVLDVGAGGRRAEDGLAVRADQPPVRGGWVRQRVEIEGLPRHRVEAVGVGLVARRQRALDDLARHDGRGAAQVDDAQAVVGDMVGDAVDLQGVGAGLQVQRHIAALGVGIGGVERARRGDLALGPLQRPLQLAVRRQRIEDDLDVARQREDVAVDLAGDLDAPLHLRDAVTRHQHAGFEGVELQPGRLGALFRGRCRQRLADAIGQGLQAGLARRP